MITIYRLRFANGVNYVGQTTNLKRRIREHAAKPPLCMKKHLQEGVSFRAQVAVSKLADATTRAEAHNLEAHHTLNLKRPDQGGVCNRLAGQPSLTKPYHAKAASDRRRREAAMSACH
jgi:predicted GIY-YIG superfamily endonuclease